MRDDDNGKERKYKREDRDRKGKIQVSRTSSGRHVVITHSKDLWG